MIRTVADLIKELSRFDDRLTVKINYMANEDDDKNDVEMAWLVHRLYVLDGTVYLADFNSDDE